jgi:hypothetical protein
MRMNCIWVNKWKKTHYHIQRRMEYSTTTATNGLQTQVHKHMELEYKCINRYIWKKTQLQLHMDVEHIHSYINIWMMNTPTNEKDVNCTWDKKWKNPHL